MSKAEDPKDLGSLWISFMLIYIFIDVQWVKMVSSGCLVNLTLKQSWCWTSLIEVHVLHCSLYKSYSLNIIKRYRLIVFPFYIPGVIKFQINFSVINFRCLCVSSHLCTSMVLFSWYFSAPKNVPCICEGWPCYIVNICIYRSNILFWIQDCLTAQIFLLFFQDWRHLAAWLSVHSYVFLIYQWTNSHLLSLLYRLWLLYRISTSQPITSPH